MIDGRNRKALVLDIDGTLTNSKKEITPATKEAIWKIMEMGHRVVLASGRPTNGMKRYERELELKERGGYLLSFNGAKIVSCKTGEVIYQNTLPMEVPARLYEFAKENGTGIISYDKDDVVLSAFRPDEYIELESRINQLPLREVPDFPEYISFPVNKCLLTADGEKNAVLEGMLKEIYGDTLSIYRSEPFFLEVMPKGVDKASSLDKILEKLDVLRENTICCGDGYNDISMIRYAGVGVAMDNANPVVKEAADYITASNDADGIVQVIEKFVMDESV